MSRKDHIKKLVCICLIVILVLVILYSGLRILESTVFLKDQNSESNGESRLIEKNGVTYAPRNDITVIMLLGIDEYGPVKDSGSYNNTGEADMVALLIFDEATEKVNVLALNRDTMLEMPALGIGGKQAGTQYGQLALSHTFGSGLKDSCKNTETAVSDFLHNLDIDYYISMNMDTISILNDAVGGVTVEVVDDFSQVDPSITKGKLTLNGQQAVTYVQVRQNVSDQKNISRMNRQKAYMEGFLSVFKEKCQDDEFVSATFDEISPYVVTDFTTKSISNMINRYEEYTLGEIVTPEGENVLKGEHYEFYADEAALEELILRLFYIPKK